MESLGKIAGEMNLTISCIPKGFEDYMTFSVSVPHKLPWGKRITYKLRFIDSLQFLTSSLASLTNNLLGQNFEGFLFLTQYKLDFTQFIVHRLSYDCIRSL